jgi:ABC-type phosphate/phosphonate transport system ATPase subunit
MALAAPGQTSSNPFRQTPIASVEQISGRAEELGEINYFLERTGAGSSSMIALVGKKGVGKTSLLNCAKEFSDKQGLVCVDMTLDHSKVKDQRSFWKSLYIAMCFAGEKKGCLQNNISMSRSLTDPLIHDGFQLPRF